MAQTVLITLTIAGADTGPFNLYSNDDGYIVPFEVSVPKAYLQVGYLSILVPDTCTIIRVKSTSVSCTNYVDLVIEGTTTTTSTTSTTTSTSTTSTTTSTTTLPPDPPTATLTFTSYESGVFTFDLSTPIFSTNIDITLAKVFGRISVDCSGGAFETDTLSGTSTIVTGATTITGLGSTPMDCAINSYKRSPSMTINGVSKINGQTITVGGTLVTVIISNSCVTYIC